MNKTRAEKHIIKSSDNHFSLILSFCKQSKNLYNHANYLIRQEFTQTKKLLKYGDLDKILKADTEYPDYQNMPTAQSAQQILKLLDKNWKAFMVSIKDWSKNKEKYLGRPKLPNYLKKNGYYVLFVSNKGIKINADLNGAYQIVKKVIPEIRWNRGCVLHPFVVNVA